MFTNIREKLAKQTTNFSIGWCITTDCSRFANMLMIAVRPAKMKIVIEHIKNLLRVIISFRSNNKLNIADYCFAS